MKHREVPVGKMENEVARAYENRKKNKTKLKRIY